MIRKNIWIFLLGIGVGITSCKKDDYGPLSDAPADVPVTVTNVYAYRPNPTVLASKATGTITMTLQIPADNPRSIKEVTKIACQANGNFSAIRDSTTVKTTGLWSNTPVTVNAKSYTFTTTFAEYMTKTGTTATPASNGTLARDFYFQFKLDNDAIIYPTSVRVWVVD